MFESKRLTNFKPYPVSPHLVWFMNKENVMKLDWNESTMNVPKRIKEKLISDIRNSNLNWYPNLKNELLYQELSKYLNVPIENILPTASSDSAHELIARAFIDIDDKTCMVYPTYDNFRSTFQSYGSKIMKFELDDNFELDYDKFDEYIKKNKIKIAYICNPNNPSGTLHKKENLLNLIKSNQKTLFIIDEAYIEFGGSSLVEESKIYDNIIVTRTFSKAFGLASFRVGYIVSSKKILNSIKKIYNPKNITQLSQNAAIYALRDIEIIKKYVSEVNESKKILLNYFKNSNLFEKIYGDSGNFLLIKSNKKKNILEFFKDKNVFFRDLSFLDPDEKSNFFRITVGSMEYTNKLLELFNEYENSNF